MISRRLVFITSLAATASSGFTLGILHARRHDAAAQASYERELQALRAEVRSELGHARTTDAVVPAATIGRTSRPKDDADGPTTGSRAKMMAEIKQELQSEMGLLPVQLLRQRRTSFVELYSYDNFGKTNYGTAGYLGHGYFITVKHAVVALREDDDRQSSRRIASVKVMYQGKEISAKVVDTGDADVEVHSGDWAIIKTKEVDLQHHLRIERERRGDLERALAPIGQLDRYSVFKLAEPHRLDEGSSRVVQLVEQSLGVPEVERVAALSLQRDAHVLEHREMR